MTLVVNYRSSLQHFTYNQSIPNIHIAVVVYSRIFVYLVETRPDLVREQNNIPPSILGDHVRNARVETSQVMEGYS